MINLSRQNCFEESTDVFREHFLNVANNFELFLEISA